MGRGGGKKEEVAGLREIVMGSGGTVLGGGTGKWRGAGAMGDEGEWWHRRWWWGYLAVDGSRRKERGQKGGGGGGQGSLASAIDAFRPAVVTIEIVFGSLGRTDGVPFRVRA
uniref:Uncharacterized protein n=1 Tax=Oryza glaberrima TaxID=4538 RepID=I1PKZ5_ORYGL